jgi:hypothetical protein
MGSDKLKMTLTIFSHRFWSFWPPFWDWKKWTVRDFSTPIFDFLVRKLSYTDLWKNSPHKKPCAWARTPPWEFYEILSIFTEFSEKWAFNTAGKSVSKIGIYALPPLKSDFYSAFNNSRPNFVPRLNI